MPPTPPDGTPDPPGDRPRVRVIRLAAGGGALALAAAIGFGLSHDTTSRDDAAVVSRADGAAGLVADDVADAPPDAGDGDRSPAT